MIKVMAILRTLFFAGIVGYMLWALPLGIMLSSARAKATIDFDVLDRVASGAWIAIAWIGMEVVFGWIKVGYQGRRELKELKARAGAPPPSRPAGP